MAYGGDLEMSLLGDKPDDRAVGFPVAPAGPPMAGAGAGATPPLGVLPDIEDRGVSAAFLLALTKSIGGRAKRRATTDAIAYLKKKIKETEDDIENARGRARNAQRRVACADGRSSATSDKAATGVATAEIDAVSRRNLP